MKEKNESNQLTDNEFERYDRIRNGFFSARAMMRLNQDDFNFARNIRRCHHIVADPEIPKEKEVRLVVELLNSNKPHATAIIKAINLIFNKPKDLNKQFQKQVIAEKFWDFAEKAEAKGDDELAIEYYEKYAKLMNLYEEKKTDERPRALPVPVFSTNEKYLEIQEAEIEVD